MSEVNTERSKQPREQTERRRQRFLRELNSFTNSLPPEQTEHKEAANNHPVVQFTSLTNSGYIFSPWHFISHSDVKPACNCPED